MIDHRVSSSARSDPASRQGRLCRAQPLDHAEEQGAEPPAAPLLFAKFPTSLIGPGDLIVIPRIVTKCDYEAELGVVLGATVKDVSKENASEAVAGHVVANDVQPATCSSATGQWTRGSHLTRSAPSGRSFPRLRCLTRTLSADSRAPERRDGAGDSTT